jgi:hypothetical protein
MATRRARALERRKEAARDPRALAADSDRALFKVAMSLAPSLRETCRDEVGLPSDEEIAIGLLVRAAAAVIVRSCPSYDVMAYVVKRMQGGLVEHVNEMILEGRPLHGRLHS